MKLKLEQYTEKEFIEFLTSGFQSARTEKEEAEWIFAFERITEHPRGSDLLFFPNDGEDDSPEGIVQQIKEWRLANGKPGFKAD